MIAAILPFLLLLVGISNGFAADRVTYIHTDILGSPVAASDEDGELLWRQRYKPYGEPTGGAGYKEEISYTSKQTDRDTGLIYLGARNYDPVVGRFLSIDPVGFDENNPPSFNRYAYVNNNPYRYVDPDGRAPQFNDYISPLPPSFDDVVNEFAGPFGSGLSRGSKNSVEKPTLDVSRSVTPGIAKNIEDAVSKGVSTRLTREESKRQIRQNRREALRGQKSAGPGKSLDEFPFASTKQGGRGACVSPVCVREQNIQGGQISQFFQRNNIRDGDDFNVRIVD